MSQHKDRQDMITRLNDDIERFFSSGNKVTVLPSFDQPKPDVRDDNDMISQAEAATILQVSIRYLQKSRRTGSKIHGITAPPFVYTETRKPLYRLGDVRKTGLRIRETSTLK